MNNKLTKIYKNKKVLITGHTGFKGSWLTLWLTMLGAKVTGISKGYPTTPSHFKAIDLKKKITHKILDIGNFNELSKIVKKLQPDFVFHLAAQSLVQKSYSDPLLTWSSNTLGSINVLESLKKIKKSCNVVMITSDKSYKNLEIKRGYKENDLLGGHDPYSASKASAELAIQSYINSYFMKKKNIRIAIARAGNVIGGGDWSENRVIPDIYKSWSKNKLALIRNPSSTRPWQHVLEAVYGYLILATKLKKKSNLHSQAFNFGPSNKKNYKVKELISIFEINWRGFKWKQDGKRNKAHESNLLKLNSKKAEKILGWKTKLNFKEAIFMTSDWYKEYLLRPKKIMEISKKQIESYQNYLKKI